MFGMRSRQISGHARLCQKAPPLRHCLRSGRPFIPRFENLGFSGRVYKRYGKQNKTFHKAKAFYFIIAISPILGLSMNYIGISPIKALIYSAILYGLTAPALIAIILHISNNKKIMGKNTNGRTSNILGVATFILITAAAVILVYMLLTGM
jgi:Mn2+/Fe2+ NRAMP family transporter